MVENANVAAIETLKGEGEGSVKKIAADAADAATLESGNLLNGTIADEYIAGGENKTYMLGAYKEGGEVKEAGFFEVVMTLGENGGEGTTHFKNNGFKSYLTVPVTVAQGAPSLAIRFDGDGTTSIDNEQLTIDNESTTIYDLMGRRVENPTKGVYIVGGRKVVIK